MSNDVPAGPIRGPAPPRQMVTLRLPTDVHNQLRAVSFFTGRSVNDIALDLITDFLATEGRQALKEGVHAITKTVERAADELEAGARATTDHAAGGARRRRAGSGRNSKARTG